MGMSIFIIGAGGHGSICAEIAYAMHKWEKIEFLDDCKIHSPLSICSIKGKVSEIQSFKSKMKDVFIGIGDNKLRLNMMNIIKGYGFSIPVLIAPFSWISPSAIIGEGTLIAEGAIIKANAKINVGCIINTGAVVEHDCVIGEGVHLSPRSTLGGGVFIGRMAWLGTGATVIPGIKIGKNTIIGAGSVVIKDIPDNCTAVGSPAKPIKWHEE